MRKEFEVEDVVKVDHDPNPWYGVIKWVGSIPDLPEKVAGIEMVCLLYIVEEQFMQHLHDIFVCSWTAHKLLNRARVREGYMSMFIL